MHRKYRIKRRLLRRGKVTVVIKVRGAQSKLCHPIRKNLKIVLIINNQFTNAANTTQIASGAGRSSAAGNNAVIDSSNTEQQQGVGAGGKARNSGMEGSQSEPHRKHRERRIHRTHRQHRKHQNRKKDDIVIVLNNQINRSSDGQSASAATQVASGGRTFSTSGTNSAIESSNAKQQHAVGGAPGAVASNMGMNSEQTEK